MSQLRVTQKSDLLSDIILGLIECADYQLKVGEDCRLQCKGDAFIAQRKELTFTAASSHGEEAWVDCAQLWDLCCNFPLCCVAQAVKRVLEHTAHLVEFSASACTCSCRLLPLSSACCALQRCGGIWRWLGKVARSAFVVFIIHHVQLWLGCCAVHPRCDCLCRSSWEMMQSPGTRTRHHGFGPSSLASSKAISNQSHRHCDVYVCVRAFCV